MATGETMIADVLDYVMDPSITDDAVLALLNEGLTVITGQLRLPALIATDDVMTVTTEYVTDLPTDYHHTLFRAYNGVSLFPITIASSWAAMIERVGDVTLTGDVQIVAPQGTTLLYLPIPLTVATLTLHYYRVATPLTESTETDAFDNLTRLYGETAIKYYAAARLYDTIEDGIEGQKVNTMRYEGLFLRTAHDLNMILREGVSHPRPPVTRPSW